ncbi:MAG: response regulator transcription factor, partial [Acidobacteriota bacterium]
AIPSGYPMAGKNNWIRIILAEDRPIFRDALKALLLRRSGIIIIGETGNWNEIQKMASEHQPDILILNPGTLRTTDPELLKSFRKLHNRLKIIVLIDSMHHDETARYFQEGANAVVSKDSPSTILFSCIKAVMTGKYWIGNKAVSRPNEKLRKPQNQSKLADSSRYGLTPREKMSSS